MKQRKERHLKMRTEEEIEIAKQVEKEFEEADQNAKIALSNTEAKGRVIAAFKNMHEDQLAVKVGDTVNILQHVCFTLNSSVHSVLFTFRHL